MSQQCEHVVAVGSKGRADPSHPHHPAIRSCKLRTSEATDSCLVGKVMCQSPLPSLPNPRGKPLPTKTAVGNLESSCSAYCESSKELTTFGCQKSGVNDALGPNSHQESSFKFVSLSRGVQEKTKLFPTNRDISKFTKQKGYEILY